MEFDSRRSASLDGIWEFFPGAHDVSELNRLTPRHIRVPGLWEAQGHLDLDGTAWYRRRFTVDDTSGGWTLRFGAVMDEAEVFLNGTSLGRHDHAFTPFEFDAAQVLAPGENELAVRVFDPPLDHPQHLRMAHGKQGWANQVFPSRPSLYMTYGGIWQPVTLRRHGPVVITDVWVNGDPEDLAVTTEVENRGPAITVGLGVRTIGLVRELQMPLGAGERATLQVGFGAVKAPAWSPENPMLHDTLVDVRAAGELSDSRAVRYGLRTIRIDGPRLYLNGDPYRMKSALVQGFRADTLYAEGTPAQVRQEVMAAQAMGFNTLRLHIKAFDPAYLDACDELGMLVHCDIPVAEPLAHEEMGGDTDLTRHCVSAARQQVRRDRNHPSVVLWSAMNEICDGRPEARRWPQYEEFARTMTAAVAGEDPTRPVIENDWVEPDPERVFVSPILTAHWYGRLHRDYLEKLERQSARWAGTGRVLLVSEFGDWGLPEMPVVADPPFWDTREAHAAALTTTLWPGTIGRFVTETQRYQGLSDRLQGEVFRRHDHIGGYCLTELTDVPQELNGLLDLERRPKPIAVAEVRRLNQAVLPMLRLESLAVAAGGLLQAPLHVVNDGPALAGASLDCRFGDSVLPMSVEELLALDASKLPPEYVMQRFGEETTQFRLGDLPAHQVLSCGDIQVAAPEVPGSHDLVLRLWSGGRVVAENRYPIHVVPHRPAAFAVRLIGDGMSAGALANAGAVVGDQGVTVIGEGALDAGAGAEMARRLGAGEVVVVLAQEPEAGPHFPVPTEMVPLATEWGSTLFRFTTDHGALPCLPRRTVLVVEDSAVAAWHGIAAIDGGPFPDTPVVIAYKPVPGALTATVAGSHAVGAGRLVFCQYRLAERAAAGDAATCALLADIVRWAAEPRPVMAVEPTTKDDGRALIRYSWRSEVAR